MDVNGKFGASKAHAVSLSNKHPYCLVLVGSGNVFKRDFTIIEVLMEDKPPL